MIISGKYEGNYIILNDKKNTFVSSDPVKLNGTTFVSTMYKEDIQSITKESEHASGDKNRVAFWLGSIAAAGMSETKIYVIRIVWQNGEESLANVTDYQYQYVLATQMKPTPASPEHGAKINSTWACKKYTFTQPYIDDSVRTLKILLTSNNVQIQYSCNKSFAFDVEKQREANKIETFPYSDITDIQFVNNKHLKKVTITRKNGRLIFINGFPDNQDEDVIEFTKYIGEKVSNCNPQVQVRESKNGCYVATCVYGSYDCPQVWTLRRFRDNTLGSTWYGRAFIRTYYTISPMIVKWFGNTAWFKKMWRGTLDRMVKKLEANGVENTPYKDKKW